MVIEQSVNMIQTRRRPKWWWWCCFQLFAQLFGMETNAPNERFVDSCSHTHTHQIFLITAVLCKRFGCVLYDLIITTLAHTIQCKPLPMLTIVFDMDYNTQSLTCLIIAITLIGVHSINRHFMADPSETSDW